MDPAYTPILIDFGKLFGVIGPFQGGLEGFFRSRGKLLPNLFAQDSPFFEIPGTAVVRQLDLENSLQLVKIINQVLRDNNVRIVEAILRMIKPREKVNLEVHGRERHFAPQFGQRTHTQLIKMAAHAFSRGLNKNQLAHMDSIQGTGFDFLGSIREPAADFPILGNMQELNGG